MDAAEETETYPDGPQLPASSCLSMKSDDSMNIRNDFTKEVADRPVNVEKSNLPTSSCLSMKSHDFMNIRHDFTKEDAESSPHFEKSNLPVSSCLSMKRVASMKFLHDFTKEDSESPSHGRCEWRRRGRDARSEESRQQAFNKMRHPCLGAVILKRRQLNDVWHSCISCP